MINPIFYLLVYFQIKHFLADYIFQTQYHLKKFLPTWEFFIPLLSHCVVHGSFTAIVVLTINPYMWWLILVDILVHFVMDRIKAGPKYLGRFKSLSAKEYNELESLPNSREVYKKKKENLFFWWSLGIDQMVHHLTDIYIIYRLVN
jgi:hypothetical protein